MDSSEQNLEANKELVRKLVEEVFNLGNPDKLADYAAPDLIDHNAVIFMAPTGPGGLADSVKSFLAGFPDFRVSLQEMIAEGDFVAARMTMAGTNSGPYRGQQATHQWAEWEAMGLFRIAGNKVLEIRGLSDRMALLTQLGILPDLA